MGSFRPGAGSQHLHWHFNFTGCIAETVLTFQHRAGVSPYTSPFGFAQTCVFAKQLLGPLLCGLVAQAPLLPKLRGHFAEFLGNASSVSLRILSSSTCVGLRYGHAVHDSGFSRRLLHALRYLLFAPRHGLSL